MAVENIIKFLPRDAVAFLRIADSDARFPIRPISEGSYLIGHGTACDLRLGDHEVPALHSILRVTRTSASITMMAERPELFVNGESVPRAVLQDGDLVEIADVRLIFRFVNEEAIPETLESTAPDAGEDDIPIELKQVEELAVPDLVTGLEIEFQLLRDLQNTSAETMNVLLNAARRSTEGASIKLAPPSLRPTSNSKNRDLVTSVMCWNRLFHSSRS
jgi:cold shock CspA family protein